MVADQLDLHQNLSQYPEHEDSCSLKLDFQQDRPAISNKRKQQTNWLLVQQQTFASSPFGGLCGVLDTEVPQRHREAAGRVAADRKHGFSCRVLGLRGRGRIHE